MAKVYDLKTQERRVELNEFVDLCMTTEKYIRALKKKRKNANGLDRAMGIVKEINLNGRIDSQFRNDTTPQLEELLDEMYLELNG